MTPKNFIYLLPALTFIFLTGCKPTPAPPTEEITPPSVELPNLGEKNVLQEGIFGTYRFSLRSISPDKPNPVMGYLTLEDEAYQYVSEQKSPYDFAFVHQSKGKFIIQFEPGITANQLFSELPTDKPFAKLTFEVFNEGDSIKEFDLMYDKAEKRLLITGRMSSLQMWRLEKPI